MCNIYLSTYSLGDLEFEKRSDATLEDLTEKLETLVETEDAPSDSDVTYSVS